MRDRRSLILISILFQGLGNLAVLLCLVLLARCVIDLGKGERDELDDDDGREIAVQMREVVERELRKEGAKL